jgi:hypothetical protein
VTGPCLPSWLLRYRDAASVNGFENGVSATPQKRLSDFASQLHGIVSVARLAENLRAIRVCDDRIQMQASTSDLCRRTNRHLASAAELIE